MFIQFDGLITDLASFEQALHLAGLFPLSVRLSRWIRTDPLTLLESDAGPRIDIELLPQPWPLAALKVQMLQQCVAASPYVVQTTGSPDA
jgi:hypothetical protein